MRGWAKLQDESLHSGGLLSLGVAVVALRKLGNISSGRLHLKFKQWKHYHTKSFNNYLVKNQGLENKLTLRTDLNEILMTEMTRDNSWCWCCTTARVRMKPKRTAKQCDETIGASLLLNRSVAIYQQIGSNHDLSPRTLYHDARIQLDNL